MPVWAVRGRNRWNCTRMRMEKPAVYRRTMERAGSFTAVAGIGAC